MQKGCMKSGTSSGSCQLQLALQWHPARIVGKRPTTSEEHAHQSLTQRASGSLHSVPYNIDPVPNACLVQAYLSADAHCSDLTHT